MTTYPPVSRASWPLRLPPHNATEERVTRIRARLDELSAASQYGWGHTIDFGAFRQEGILGEAYLDVLGLLDEWRWWSRDLSGMSVADVGCFSGAASLFMAARGAEKVYAIDELPGHLDQCAYLAGVFEQPAIEPVNSSLYALRDRIPEGSLDLILLSGVLYHLSDMLAGLLVLRQLLKPGGVLIIETNGVDDFEQSYANFGRFCAGMWWQPSGLCVQDMCEFMGLTRPETRFYVPSRCLARATRAPGEIPFRRGLSVPFADLGDARPRPLDYGVMAPVKIAKE